MVEISKQIYWYSYLNLLRRPIAKPPPTPPPSPELASFGMGPTHSTEMLKHLEKQNVLLMEAYRTMSHELHRLQVEEEMLMHKLYKLMYVEGLLKKEKKGDSEENMQGFHRTKREH